MYIMCGLYGFTFLKLDFAFTLAIFVVNVVKDKMLRCPHTVRGLGCGLLMKRDRAYPK
jgi:hypothetical protein